MALPLPPYGVENDHAQNEEVLIGQYPYKVIGPVKPQQLGRWQNKITTGDPTQDSDPLLSAYSMSGFPGGMGNFILREGVDDESYWTATMETRWPHILTALPRTDRHGDDLGAGQASALGDFPASGPMFHVAFDADIYRWNEGTGSFDQVVNGSAVAATLPSHPRGKGVELANKLYIPLGTDGLAALDTTGTVTMVTDGAATVPAVDLAWYDYKLAVLTTEGQVRILLPDGTWEVASDALTVPSGAEPTGILTFIDQQQNPTLHVVTTQGVWAYDRENAVLLRTHLQYPRHPYQGRASTVFRGDSMYVSVGIGIHGYDGSTITAMGPDNRYGLPASLRGYIVDLEQEYNGLLALVQGADSAAATAPTHEITPPGWRGREARFTAPETVSALLRWNQQGWHPVWRSSDAEGVPSNVIVSQAEGAYRLWWGYDGAMYTQVLPLGFHNPKVGMQVGVDRFADRGELITGWFDANMSAFDKLAAHIELTVEDVFGDGTPCGDVAVSYQIDAGEDTANWIPLRTVSGVGRYAMPFGNTTREDGTGFSRGVHFKRIRFRIETRSASETVTPLVANVLFKFLKIPISQWSWTVTVDLATKGGYGGVDNETLRNYLIGLTTSEEFTRFTHRGQTSRVRIAQTTGWDEAGLSDASQLTVSIIEVHVPPDDASDSDGYVSHTRLGGYEPVIPPDEEPTGEPAAYDGTATYS